MNDGDTVLGRLRAADLVPWAAPVLLVVLARWYPTPLPALLPGVSIALLAIGFVVVASHRPDRCLTALVAFLPFQVFGPALLLAWGVPQTIVRAVGGWRELLAVALAIAAVRHVREHGRPIDKIVVLSVGYVVLTGVYALVPTLWAVDAPTDADVRSLGWRALAGFVVLLVVCREAGFGEPARRAVERGLLLGAAVVAAGALWEAVDDESWNRFAVETVRVNEYRARVLGLRVLQPDDVRSYGVVAGQHMIRSSSVFGSPLPLAHYLLVPFAIAIEKLLRGRTPGMTLLTVVFGAAILTTQTRSALLGGIIVVWTALRRSRGRTRPQRTRLALLTAAVVIVATPIVLSAGLTARFGDDESTTQHRDSFWEALDAVAHRPLGAGVGTSAGIGQRFGTSGVIAENYYLQVAQEVGILGGIVFGGLVISVNRQLRRARDETGDRTVAGIRSGVLGVSVAAMFLHTFSDPSVSWTVFALAGLGLAAVPSPAPVAVPGRSEPVPSSR